MNTTKTCKVEDFNDKYLHYGTITYNKRLVPLSEPDYKEIVFDGIYFKVDMADALDYRINKSLYSYEIYNDNIARTIGNNIVYTPLKTKAYTYVDDNTKIAYHTCMNMPIKNTIYCSKRYTIDKTLEPIPTYKHYFDEQNFIKTYVKLIKIIDSEGPIYYAVGF